MSRMERYLDLLERRRFLLEGCRGFYPRRGREQLLRDPPYWVPTRFVQSAETEDDIVAGLALFLRTWNWMKYARMEAPDAELERALRRALRRSRDDLRRLESATIFNLGRKEVMAAARAVFRAFAREDEFVGMTGASKAAHALRPKLFVPWDNAIRAGYHRLHPGFWGRETQGDERACRGEDSPDYCYSLFLLQSRAVARKLGQLRIRHGHPLNRYGFPVYVTKALDECNYLALRRKDRWGGLGRV